MAVRIHVYNNNVGFLGVIAKLTGVALVDFHTHTTTSDGVWTTEALFSFVRERGLAAFSLTDHDTMDGYPVPDDLADRTIAGMEVDTKCEGITAHLLVYGLRSPDAPLLQHLRTQRKARAVRMAEMIDRLRASNIIVTMDEVRQEAGSAASLGRPHLARVLVTRGIVANVQEAFDRYLADDREGYVSLDRLTSERAIALAHESGAIVSVAHPCRLKAPASLDALRQAGADAVEVVHPSADAAAQRDLRDYAERYGMLVTGGSDFHAPENGYAPGIELDNASVERFLDVVSPISDAGSNSKFASGRMDARV